jgi:hypothetical protein
MPSAADLIIADGIQTMTRSALSQEVIIEQAAGVQFTVRAVTGSGESAESTQAGVAKTALFWAGDFDLSETPDGTRPTMPDEKQFVIFGERKHRIVLVRRDAAVQSIDCLLQSIGKA